MYFSVYNILSVVYIAGGMALVAMLWLLLAYRKRVRLDFSSRDNDDGDACLPSLSVIVYACDNASDLREMLPDVLEQQYPVPFEVIVVNDGSSDEVTDTVNLLSVKHRNLYITFVPDEAHNLSRKKLGISLGIKAARHDCVVLTTASCRVESKRWLAAMGRRFADGFDVVLGWARIDGLCGMMKKFDEVATATTWLSAAQHGRPYRGTGYNVGYRRKLFFDAKGFSRSLNLHNGDDDLFINQISTTENTAVELSPDARLSVRCYNPDVTFRELKMNHCFTARFLPKRARRFMGVSTFVMWLWIASVAVAAVFSIPNMLPSCVLAAMIPLLWIPLTLAWRRTGRGLGVGLNGWLLWWVMLWRWIPNMVCRMRCGSAKRRNYTWLQK